MWSLALVPVAAPSSSPTSAKRAVVISLVKRTSSVCIRAAPDRGVPRSDRVEIESARTQATASRSVSKSCCRAAISFDEAA